MMQMRQPSSEFTHALAATLAMLTLFGCHGVSPIAPSEQIQNSAASTTSFKSIYSFAGGPDGSNPEAALIVLNGALYGATAYGGSGYGTVFTVMPFGQEEILYRFGGPPRDGAFPSAELILFNNALRTGGYCDNGYFRSVGCGTIFSISTSGQETMLYSFTGGKDGGFPDGNLVARNGWLYGTMTLDGQKKPRQVLWPEALTCEAIEKPQSVPALPRDLMQRLSWRSD